MEQGSNGHEGQNRQPEDVVILNTSLIQMAFDKKKEADAQERQEIDELRERAELADCEAQRMLGLRYASGDGVEKDLDAAIHWLLQAGEAGDMQAQDALAGCYRAKANAETDEARREEWYVKAFELYTQGAEQGYPPPFIIWGWPMRMLPGWRPTWSGRRSFTARRERTSIPRRTAPWQCAT